MTKNEMLESVDTAVSQVDESRRGFLRQLLIGVGVAAALPMMSSVTVAEKVETIDQGKGKGKGDHEAKGKGEGKGKGDHEAKGKGEGKGKGDHEAKGKGIGEGVPGSKGKGEIQIKGKGNS